jgi:large subunit ribosomal protein L10
VPGPKADKVAAVDEVRGHLEHSSGAILTDYRGLKVADLATLRRALRLSGAEYKIYKNTLVRRASSESGHGAILALLVGPTAIAFVDSDVAAAAKVLRDFARTHPALVVKGSLIGTDLLDARSTTALADLPSRELLLAQIAGALAAPMQKLAGLLQALPRNFAYGLSALVEQRVAGGEQLPEPSAETQSSADEEVVTPAADEEVVTPAADAEAGAVPTDDASDAEAGAVPADDASDAEAGDPASGTPDAEAGAGSQSSADTTEADTTEAE